MNTLTKPLLALEAADVMSTPVITVPKQMSIKAAAHLLAQAGISGAPVIDGKGRLVGVLSANDFVSWAEEGGPGHRSFREVPQVHSPWQLLDPERVESDEVGTFMTPDPVTVAPATPLTELARMMLDAHIHRVIVVDADMRPVGVVSTTDVLAALANSDRSF